MTRSEEAERAKRLKLPVAPESLKGVKRVTLPKNPMYLVTEKDGKVLLSSKKDIRESLYPLLVYMRPLVGDSGKAQYWKDVYFKLLDLYNRPSLKGIKAWAKSPGSIELSALYREGKLSPKEREILRYQRELLPNIIWASLKIPIRKAKKI